MKAADKKQSQRRKLTTSTISALVWTVAMLECGAHSAMPPESPRLLELSGDLAVHDPAIIKAKDIYYVFATGGGRRGLIPIRTSTNLVEWTRRGSALESIPNWGVQEIPRARDAWAPDISFFAGKYHLYYSLSSFGANESAIGLAINSTLDSTDPLYHWEDRGMVIRSKTGVDDFNAIDPNVVIENPERVWLCWGSFWSGIKMCRIDPATGKPSVTDTNIYSIASRNRQSPSIRTAGEGAIEAPTIVKHGDYWYLFASYDYCCRGTNSTYNVKAGRAMKVTGPYVDRKGIGMTDDGGTEIVPAITSKWKGAGHQAVLDDASGSYLVLHAYDPTNGRSRLQILRMRWEDGWPLVVLPD